MPKRSQAETQEPVRQCPPEYPAKLPPSWLLATTNPIMDARFIRRIDEHGEQRVFQVTDEKECTLQTGDALLYDHLSNGLVCAGYYPPSQYVIDVALAFWRRTGNVILTDPVAFAFSDQDKYCFRKLDWTPSKMPFPAWQEFLDRLSSAETYCAFVGSCFDDENTGRQFLWLYGPHGQDGKTFTLTALSKLFGSAGCAITGDVLKSSNQFTASNWYGKRVAVYADCKNTQFGMSEKLRNITSGDPIPIEYKGKPIFNASIRLKLFVASNDLPQLTGGNADKSRLLLIEVAPSANTNDPAWLVRLEEQLPGFIWHCQREYERLVTNHGNIPVPDSVAALVEGAVDSFEDIFVATFADQFELDPTACTRAQDVRHMLEQTNRHFESPHVIHDWYMWLVRKYGISKVRRSDGLYYLGIRFRGGRGV